MSLIKQRLLAAIEHTPKPLLEQTLAFLESLRASEQEDTQLLPDRPASGRSLSRHANQWQGNDLKDCLDAVYASRGTAEF